MILFFLTFSKVCIQNCVESKKYIYIYILGFLGLFVGGDHGGGSGGGHRKRGCGGREDRSGGCGDRAGGGGDFGDKWGFRDKLGQGVCWEVQGILLCLYVENY